MPQASSALARSKALTASVEVLAGVRRRHLGADARLAHGDDRVAEADDVDALFGKSSSAMRPARAASPIITGTIGCSPGRTSKPRPVICSRKHAVFALQGRPQVVALVEQVEHDERGGRDRRGDRVGEQVRPRALAQQVDDLPAAARVAAARAAERLAERAGDDVDPVRDPVQLRRAAAVLARRSRRRASRRPSPWRRSARPARRSRRSGAT